MVTVNFSFQTPLIPADTSYGRSGLPSSRTVGGKSKSGLAKVIISPWTRFQSPSGRVMALSESSMEFCVLASVILSSVPWASMQVFFGEDRFTKVILGYFRLF